MMRIREMRLRVVSAAVLAVVLVSVPLFVGVPTASAKDTNYQYEYHARNVDSWEHGDWAAKWTVTDTRSYVWTRAWGTGTKCLAVQDATRIDEHRTTNAGAECQANTYGTEDAQHDYVAFDRD